VTKAWQRAEGSAVIHRPHPCCFRFEITAANRGRSILRWHAAYL